MATFLKGARKGRKEEPAVNGSTQLSVGPPDLGGKTAREEKEENNTTEYEYMRSMFADLMSTMPVTPVPKRPGRIGKQPQGSDACRLLIGANNANLTFSLCFNKGDSAGCAGTYMKGALMEARPQGIIFGRTLIQMFWTNVHTGNPGPIRYQNVRMRVVDEDTVTFSSDWTFNNMRGIIMLETWRRQCDGSFELDEDRFKIEEVYPSPRVATPEQEVLGLQPLYNINEVMEAVAARIDMFNSGNVDGFVNSYTPDALQTVDPLANSRGRDSIRKIVAHYIENRKTFGNGRLTYNNFCVKAIDAGTVHLSGDWDLGGRDNPSSVYGYMNCQKYVKQSNGKWLLESDDWTIQPTEFLY